MPCVQIITIGTNVPPHAPERPYLAAPWSGSLLSAQEWVNVMAVLETTGTLEQPGPPPRPRHERSEPIPADAVAGLLAMAARAPSIFNTQPWLFRVTTHTIELYADQSRRLRSDAGGREMTISCGAALFGLRLGIRSLGYQPVTTLLPDPERPTLLAKVQMTAGTPPTESERALIGALPHRHTNRGAFVPGPLPRGLLIGLQHDAVAERARLALIDRPLAFNQLSDIVARSTGTLNADDRARADVRQWVRPPGSPARDGVPASAIAGQSAARPGRLAQRDLDLGRGIGELTTDGPPPGATAILLTSADTRADWLRAGQALHRILAHAACQWVVASLHSQPLESAPTRALIRSRLALSGAPQLLLQFGLADTARPTARRPADDVLVPGRHH